MYKHFFKRLFDFLIALVALLLIGWLLIIIAIWLHFANKGAGAFFFQERPGKDAKVFKVIKFKTMTDEKDAEGKLLPDAQRLTKAGRFVRSTSIDELPQLINVLKGDMSLIGPRPLTIYYLRLFNDFQKRRLEVRPGISGWAQIHGRNHCKLSKKFEYDVWYVDHCTIMTDIKIILVTIMNVIMRKDIGEGANDMSDIDDLGMGKNIEKMIDAENAKISNPILLDVNQCLEYKDRLIEFYYLNSKSCSCMNDFSHSDAKLKIESMIEHVTDGSAIVFGVLSKGDLIGYVWAYEHQFREENRMYISEIHVNEFYRGRGIGKSLLSAVELISRKRGYCALYIHAEGQNEGAIRLYEKEGYKIERVQLRKEL